MRMSYFIVALALAVTLLLCAFIINEGIQTKKAQKISPDHILKPGQFTGMRDVYTHGFYVSRDGVKAGLIRTNRYKLEENQGEWIYGYVYDPEHQTNLYTVVFIPVEDHSTSRFVFERSN